MVALAAIFAATWRRHGVVLLVLMAYVGMGDGFVRLTVNDGRLTIVRDLLFYALVAGILVRLATSGERPRTPPYTGWIVGFAAVVVAQLLNPFIYSPSAAIQGIRPHLEWVPLFFFGFAYMRDPRRLRVLLYFLLVVGAVNGAVSWVQAQLTPEQFAAWGPGYADRVLGQGAFGEAGRVYWDEMGPHVRPFGLGSDSSFGGLVGFLAVPAGLALLATRQRMGTVVKPLVAVLLAGCVVGIVVSQQRTSVVGAVIVLACFAVLTASAGRVVRTAVVCAVVGVMTVGVVSLVGNQSEYDPFERYTTISPTQVLGATGSERGVTFAAIPGYLTKTPFGIGLGRAGPATGLSENGDLAIRTGGVVPNSETEITYLLSELGIPGLAVVLAIHLMLAAAALRSVRRIRDHETRLLVAAVGAPLLAMLAAWLSTTTTANVPLSPYFWFAGGAIAYWHSVVRPGPGRA